MTRFSILLALAATLAAGTAGLASASGLVFLKPHVVLLWEDAGGFSDDVAAVEGPIEAVTDAGRSLQMVVDLMIEGESDVVYEIAPVLKVVARSVAGERPVLFERSWPIEGIGEFGTTMRSFIVDHGCAGVSVVAEIEEAGTVVDRFERTYEIVCR